MWFFCLVRCINLGVVLLGLLSVVMKWWKVVLDSLIWLVWVKRLWVWLIVVDNMNFDRFWLVSVVVW